MQLFGMWDFQEELIEKFDAHRYNIVKFPRQCGKCIFPDELMYIKNDDGEEMEFTVEEFCPSFKADDRESFNKLLDAFREDLKEENGLISEQRQRQQDLMELPESLTRVCD